ncbi:unnamed protein product [Lathyrus oleraceus]
MRLALVDKPVLLIRTSGMLIQFQYAPSPRGVQTNSCLASFEYLSFQMIHLAELLQKMKLLFAAMVRVLCDIKETHLSCLQARLQGERCVEEDAGVLIKETW